MKTTTLTEIVISLSCGALLGIFSEMCVIFVITLIAIVADYLFGITAAAISGELSSKKGLQGLLKKVGYFGVIISAMLLDALIIYGLPLVGIEYNLGSLITGIVCVWFIVNELISILENLSHAGVPMPEFLEKIIKEIKNKVDK